MNSDGKKYDVDKIVVKKPRSRNFTEKKTAGTKSDGKKYNLKKHAAKTKRAEKKFPQII